MFFTTIVVAPLNPPIRPVVEGGDTLFHSGGMIGTRRTLVSFTPIPQDVAGRLPGPWFLQPQAALSQGALAGCALLAPM